ncbi:hypothetical protein BCN13_26125, partial [Salmonella enterica]|nr:hypothetical protein [Salmonella enterica]
GRNMPGVQAIFIFIKGKPEDVKTSVPEGDYPAQQQKKKNGQTFRQIATNWHADHRQVRYYRWGTHGAAWHRAAARYGYPDEITTRPPPPECLHCQASSYDG